MFDSLLVVVHIPAGVIAVITGAGAMLAEKGGHIHRRCGLIYLGALTVVGLSGVGLVVTRWPRLLHLFALGLVAAALATIGYAARGRRSPTVHLVCMGGSYIAMLTAFYVDNGAEASGLEPAAAGRLLVSAITFGGPARRPCGASPCAAVADGQARRPLLLVATPLYTVMHI